MSRSRRPTNVPRPELARKAKIARTAAAHDERPQAERGPVQAFPNWQWKTFPVFFALAVGLFIGVFVGIPAGIANEHGNTIPSLVMFLVAAILLGAGLSRFTTRWMLARNWPKRKQE